MKPHRFFIKPQSAYDFQVRKINNYYSHSENSKIKLQSPTPSPPTFYFDCPVVTLRLLNLTQWDYSFNCLNGVFRWPRVDMLSDEGVSSVMTISNRGDARKIPASTSLHGNPLELMWDTIFIMSYLGLWSGSVFRLTVLSSELLLGGTLGLTAFAIK